eukprot:3463776-Amphidinium_carterae.1
MAFTASFPTLLVTGAASLTPPAKLQTWPRFHPQQMASLLLKQQERWINPIIGTTQTLLLPNP